MGFVDRPGGFNFNGSARPDTPAGTDAGIRLASLLASEARSVHHGGQLRDTPLNIPKTAEPLVRFQRVQKTYDGEHLVVRQLDLDIHRGEFLSLLGPSGSGKTTTLMMLAGFESPTSGDILLNGRQITGTPPHKRHFGMVFQNYALFPHLTVGQNVAYPLTVRKVSKDDQTTRVKRALDMVQLKGMTDRLPGQLSGGQQQRVALARALVFEPQLVLMDEPLGALDKQLREHMQLELKEIHRQLGVTFVYVTHDQGEALTMSDRVAVFNEGVIQQLDTVDRLYEMPANRFVAGFVGDNTVLKGTLQTAGEHAVMALPDGRLLGGLNVGGSAAGAAVEMCIRPERVVLHPAGSAPSENTLAAEVARVIYYGDHLRLLCNVGAGQAEATVKLPMSGLIGLTPPQAGDSVSLELPVVHTRIYAV
ncbi:ABC transporter ATP-binding protein [Variovorax sp. PAMC28562]|nr:ABC transporter ATP-binding protein [Variovorax sp. PAMC28562]